VLAQTGQCPIHVAIESSSEATVRVLKRYGAKWTAADKDGNNALHYVAMNDRLEICKLLDAADWAATLPAKNADGVTPLHALVELGGSPELAFLFVQKGADVMALDGQGRSALALAEVCACLSPVSVSDHHVCQRSRRRTASLNGDA
jgi:ankyrin repeat protein